MTEGDYPTRKSRADYQSRADTEGPPPPPVSPNPDVYEEMLPSIEATAGHTPDDDDDEEDAISPEGR